MKNKKMTALFAALSAFLAVSESFIPTPVPFIRLGISNIPLCLGLSIFNTREILYIAAFKVLISHLFRGTLLSYPFLVALCGNILFLLITIPLYAVLQKHISFISISVIGAAAHNTGQLIGALLFIPLQTTLMIAILLLPAGIITGCINGTLCNVLYNRYFTGAPYGEPLSPDQ